MSLIVRRLKVADLPALEQIEIQLIKRFPHRVGWLENYRKIVERSLAEEPEGLLIADLDGRVVGSAIARQCGAHPMNGLSFGQIVHLSAAPGFEQLGISLRLLRECEAYLRSRDCRVAQLRLPADATMDAELYKNGGYQVAAWELERSLE